jgi:serine O-acetyltransferase
MLNALNLHRIAHELHRRGIPGLPRLLRKTIELLYGSYIGTEAVIGEGTELAYSGLGIVIHPAAKIGRQVLVGPHVTIGGRSTSKGAPIIEDGVKIGAGACILGDIRIGTGALIGANAVVTHDVAPRTIMAGVPARRIGEVASEEAPPSVRGRAS